MSVEDDRGEVSDGRVRKFTAASILKEITGRRRNRVFVYQKYVELFNEAG